MTDEDRQAWQEAEHALAGLNTASDILGASLRDIGEDLKASLEAAAQAGELSFARLGEALKHSLAQAAFDHVAAPMITQMFEGVSQHLGLGIEGSHDATAAPRASSPSTLPPISITIHNQGGGPLEASESQIASTLARAVRRGMTRL